MIAWGGFKGDKTRAILATMLPQVAKLLPLCGVAGLSVIMNMTMIGGGRQIG